MTDRTVRVRLEAITGMYQAKLAQAAATTKTFGSTVTKATGQSRQGFNVLGLGMVGFGAAVVGGLGVANKAAIDFESSFAGVRKTVSGTPAQLNELAHGFRELALELPVNVNELNRIGESAGQLGIKRKAILGFVETIAKLGVTTDLAGEQAAKGLARVGNIMQTSQRDFDRMGSTIVALGNAGASTESEIVDMSLGIAGAANIAGLSESDVLGFANALSSVGIEAEAGGSSLSRVMLDIGEAVDTGGEKLEGFASVAGMSVADFKRAFEEDAAGAIVSFIEGLGRIEESGGNVTGTLRELGFSEIRVRRMLLNTAGAGDLLRESLDLGNKAWRENIALNEEAAKRFGTTESQVQLAKNAMNDLAITVGDMTRPAFEAAVGAVRELVIDLNALPEPLKVAAVGLTTVSGLAVGLGGAFILAAPAIASVKTALAGLGVTAAGLARVAAPIGALLTMLQQLADLMANIEEHGLGGGLERHALKVGVWITKAIGASQAAHEFQEKLEGLDDAGEKAGASLLGLVRTIPHAAAQMVVLGVETEKVATVHELAAEMADKQRLAELGLAGGLVGLMANMQSVDQAERELNEARREFIGLTNSGARGTDKWREAQRRYREAQIGALQSTISAKQSIMDYGKELVEAGVPQHRVNELVRDFGRRAGLTKGEINELIDRVREHIRTLKDVPPRIHSEVTATTTKARNAISRFFEDLSQREIEVIVHSRLVRGGVDQKHSGGWMGGPSASPRDMPIVAQGGEFMVRRDVARQHAGMLEALNAGRIYHDGGWVAHPQLNVNLARLVTVMEEAKKGFLSGNLVQVAHQLQGMGFRISGHPAFPPIGEHVAGSWHYKNRAWDANYGPPGESAIEKAAIAKVVPMLAALPHVELLHPGNDPDHDDHLHYAMQGGAYIKQPFTGFVSMAERSPEIVAPQPVLRQIVREESRPMGPQVLTGRLKIVDFARGMVEIIDGRIEQGVGPAFDRTVFRLGG